MSVVIGKGETKTIMFNIQDKDKVFSSEDTLLFALKKKDNPQVALKSEKAISDLKKENEEYIFNVELASILTQTFEVGKCKYEFDLTLVKGEKKIPLTNVYTVDVTETVGASISEE